MQRKLLINCTFIKKAIKTVVVVIVLLGIGYKVYNANAIVEKQITKVSPKTTPIVHKVGDAEGAVNWTNSLTATVYEDTSYKSTMPADEIMTQMHHMANSITTPYNIDTNKNKKSQENKVIMYNETLELMYNEIMAMPPTKVNGIDVKPYLTGIITDWKKHYFPLIGEQHKIIYEICNIVDNDGAYARLNEEAIANLLEYPNKDDYANKVKNAPVNVESIASEMHKMANSLIVHNVNITEETLPITEDAIFTIQDKVMNNIPFPEPVDNNNPRFVFNRILRKWQLGDFKDIVEQHNLLLEMSGQMSSKAIKSTEK